MNTGFGLLDHMLTLTAFWAGMDLRLDCKGDLQVDAHHTAEDVGRPGKAAEPGDRVGLLAWATAACPWTKPWPK